MAIKKMRINQKNATGYDVLFPETSADQVIVTDGKTVAEHLNNKINTSDIVNNLTSTLVNKPLSAAQGKVIDDKINVHLGESATTSKAGHVQLSNAINSTSQTLAATPYAVKQAYDLAQAAKTDGNNVKANMVSALLSVDNSLPITNVSNWTDIVAQTGNISTGKKYQTGTGACGHPNGSSLANTFDIMLPFNFSFAKIRAKNGDYASDYFIQRIRLNRYVEVYGLFSSGHLTASSGTQNLALITKDTLLVVTDNTITLKRDASYSISGYNYLFNPGYTYDYTVYE